MITHTCKKETSGRLAIVVGGGPAPGINGVIRAATIEAINSGLEVIGIYDGFKWLAAHDTSKVRHLTIDDVSRIHFNGGSILRTSRENPTKSKERLDNVVQSLKDLGVNYLLTIGGDDTAFSACKVGETAGDSIRVVHVPKTIDNDLPLPGDMPTFGYQTARHEGVRIVQQIMEDARTTGRWYFIVSMGRKAGHLALGIGRAAGATCTLIGEEFGGDKVPLDRICDVLEGSILKRRSMGKDYGVAVIAEGILDKVSEDDLAALKDVERDEHGHVRYAEISLCEILKNEVRRRLAARGMKTTIVGKDIGYELRCAPPIPFDCEYTQDLGHAGVRFLLDGGSGAIISMFNGKKHPLTMEDLMDPATGRLSVRLVDVENESFGVALKYMIRLTGEDFSNRMRLESIAASSNMTPEEFWDEFGWIGEGHGIAKLVTAGGKTESIGDAALQTGALGASSPT